MTAPAEGASEKCSNKVWWRTSILKIGSSVDRLPTEAPQRTDLPW
jgi:hypothetical protein